MEADAFERALRPLLRRSAAYAASILHDRRAAEDAVQQAALRAWEQRAGYDPTRPFPAWWFAILRNLCIDAVRRRRPVGLEPACEPTDPAPLHDGDVLDRRALDRALEQLPDSHSEALKLRYFADLSYAEMAAVLEVPVGTVMSRLHLARKALAGRMRTEEP